MADNGIKAGEAVEVRVSVIMPAWNCAGTIGKAIDSVLVQDVPLELIVVNDTSPDDLDAVMKTYASDPRVRYVKNEHNLGASGSRNRGVALAKGSYVAFLDADDWWEKGKLKKQMQLLTATQAVLCSTGRELLLSLIHISKEPGTRMLLEAIDIPVFLDCDMCLGEGTGAVAIFPLLDLALSVYNGMSTFADNDIEQYVPQN